MKNIGEVIDKIERERFFRRINFILFIVLIGLIIFYIKGINYQEIEKIEINHNFTSLEEIVRYEIKTAIENNITGNCYDFMIYYNQRFRKYPEMDIRPIRYADICNGCTLCNNTHTYLVVNSWGAECIVDQTQYACVNVLK